MESHLHSMKNIAASGIYGHILYVLNTPVYQEHKLWIIALHHQQQQYIDRIPKYPVTFITPFKQHLINAYKPYWSNAFGSNSCILSQQHIAQKMLINESIEPKTAIPWIQPTAITDWTHVLRLRAAGWFVIKTHCGLVTPNDDIDMGQHWLR